MESEVSRLDHLFKLLARGSESEAARIAHEHVQGARIYLLGAMDVEYNFNLELARQEVARISSHELREQAESILASLLEGEALTQAGGAGAHAIRYRSHD